MRLNLINTLTCTLTVGTLGLAAVVLAADSAPNATPTADKPAVVAAPAQLSASSAKTTQEYLQMALDQESTVKTRDEAFAVKADEEGYKAVAVLFRAAAKAEEIHIQKLTRGMTKLGLTPKAVVGKVEVHSTAENVELTAKNSTADAEGLYTAALKQAETDPNKEKSVTLALYGTKMNKQQMNRLFTKAGQNLNEWKAEGKSFPVCTVCGFMPEVDAKNCPLCSAGKEKFEWVK